MGNVLPWLSVNTTVYSAILSFFLLFPHGTKSYKNIWVASDKPQGKAQDIIFIRELAILYWEIMSSVKAFLSIMLLINICYLFFLPFQTISFLISKITKVNKELHENFPLGPLHNSSNLPNSIFFHLTGIHMRPQEFEFTHLSMYLNLAFPLLPLHHDNLSSS